MIYSDKQYRISSGELTKLKDALNVAQMRETDQEWLKIAEIDALKSQIEEIKAELAHYDLLKAGQITFAKSFALESLPSILIQARIASGMSQTDLAKALGLKPQQIQRDEASNYMGASLAKLIEISRLLGVHIEELFETDQEMRGSVFSWKNVEDVVWRQFPFKEMIERKWFTVPHGGDPIEKVREYFLDAAGPQFATVFHRKKMHSGTIPNEYALLAWQARVLDRAREAISRHGIPAFELDDRWIKKLVALTRRKDGPRRARHLLAEKGIVLITEEHLPGTYLDGAAMMDDTGRPVIGLTLRYDRLDNFWFVLFHELGHVFLHLMDGLHYDFFDEEGTRESDKVETDADRFALDSLIPSDDWDKCLSRFALSEEAVQIDAGTLGIDPSIIAGRIRKEQADYTILNSLVGQGAVRPQLVEVDNAAE